MSLMQAEFYGYILLAKKRVIEEGAREKALTVVFWPNSAAKPFSRVCGGVRERGGKAGYYGEVSDRASRQLVAMMCGRQMGIPSDFSLR